MRRNWAEDVNRYARQRAAITPKYETEEQLINRLAPRSNGGLVTKLTEDEILQEKKQEATRLAG